LRIGQNKILGLTGAAAFFAVLIVNAPATMIAPLIKGAAPGISFSMIGGTLWHARISGLRAEGVTLGNVNADINLLALFTGALSYDVEIKGQAVNGEARFSQSLIGGVEIRDADFSISRAFLRRYALLGVPVDGSAVISNASIIINNKGCVSAEGTIRTDALSAVARQFGMGALDLVGPLRCVDGRITMQLDGVHNDFGSVSVSVTELEDFRYRMAVIVETPDEAFKQSLRLAGFESDGDAVVYEEIYSWISAPDGAVDTQQQHPTDTGA
jgi:hypothetical protein